VRVRGCLCGSVWVLGASASLQYVSSKRIDPLSALAHPFFDELRLPETRLPSGDPLPPLFNFSETELASARHLGPKLIPPHARNAENWPAGLYDGVEMGGAGAGGSPSGGAGGRGSSSRSVGAAAKR
jgi:hypothetical protein